METDYDRTYENYPSHSEYENLQNEVVFRVDEIKKLPDEMHKSQLKLLVEELYEQHGMQYDMQTI